MPNQHVFPMPGSTVSLRYMTQPTLAQVVGLHLIARREGARLTPQLDAPLDVQPQSELQISPRRITAVIRPDGTFLRRGADGVPHLAVSAIIEP